MADGEKLLPILLGFGLANSVPDICGGVVYCASLDEEDDVNGRPKVG